MHSMMSPREIQGYHLALVANIDYFSYHHMVSAELHKIIVAILLLESQLSSVSLTSVAAKFVGM